MRAYQMKKTHLSDFPFGILIRDAVDCYSGWRPCIDLMTSEKQEIFQERIGPLRYYSQLLGLILYI